MARTGKLALGAISSALALALAAVLLALVATPPADAASRYKVVTRTFANAQPITIPAGDIGRAAPYPSEISVGGFGKRGKVLDVNLTLEGFSNESPFDVDAMLYHRGVGRAMMSDAGWDYPVSGLTLVLDDEAAGPLPVNDPLVSGTFKPTNVTGGDGWPAPAPPGGPPASLAEFDGGNPNGPWQLWINDPFFVGVGQIDGWSVTIKARVLRR